MITLKTLPEATAQEVFNQVVNHLMTQMKQSRRRHSDDDRCVYRLELPDDQGVLKCAAGCLIADDEYRQEMDTLGNSGWLSLIHENLVPSNHDDLIAQLQSVHDENEPNVWGFRLVSVAKFHGLEIPRILIDYDV